jgi:hypothetical protein
MQALFMLYTLQARALVRRLGRSMRSVKGALLAIFGVLVIGLWLAPSVWQAHAGPRTDPQRVRDAAPMLLLTMAVMSLVTSGGEKAVAFTPAEVDFQFPGPFTRRQLLAYKIGKALAGLLFSATLLAIVFLRHSTGWLQAWCGLFLAMLFMHLLSMAIALVAQSTGERVYNRWRKAIVGLVIFVVGGAVTLFVHEAGLRDFAAISRALRGSRAGTILLAPLDVFGQLFTAGSWHDGLVYGSLAVGVNGVLAVVVFYLDADYLEAAAARSQAVYARIQRLRKGGLSALAGPGKRARGVVPRLPFMGGMGPIVWRQMTNALRSSRGLLLVLLIVAVVVGPIVVTSRKGAAVGTPVLGIVAWITLFVVGWLRFDFRADLDLMDHLKSLPLRPWAVAAGQIATPTLLMTACHAVIIGGIMAVSHRFDGMFVAAVALSLPFNVLLFGLENQIFLLFPSRAAATPADFQGYGRQILVFFATGLLILIAGGLAGTAGYAVYLVSGSRPAGVAAAGVVLTLTAAATIPAVGWAYERFDVATDVPA